MKRRRLRSKQRPPPCYDEKRDSEDGHVLPLAASAAVAVGESHACEAGLQKRKLLMLQTQPLLKLWTMMGMKMQMPLFVGSC